MWLIFVCAGFVKGGVDLGAGALSLPLASYESMAQASH